MSDQFYQLRHFEKQLNLFSRFCTLNA